MQRFCSVFQQILKLIPRVEFQQLADRHGSDRRSKGFSSWSQFVAMIFCQLGRAQSLREIEQGLASAEGRLQQLGIDRPAKRTTLAYANAHRPWELYRDVFESLFARCQAIEGAAAAQFAQQGVDKDVFKIGDPVEVIANPSRSPNSTRARLIKITRTTDGKSWGGVAGQVVD